MTPDQSIQPMALDSAPPTGQDRSRGRQGEPADAGGGGDSSEDSAPWRGTFPVAPEATVLFQQEVSLDATRLPQLKPTCVIEFGRPDADDE
ncbi:MAG: hypothetical protein U0797_05540 [Gemmataceae bacterium]